MKITYKNKRLNKFLKTTSIVLSSFVASGLIAAKTYDLHIDSKLEEISYNEENIKKKITICTVWLITIGHLFL